MVQDAWEVLRCGIISPHASIQYFAMSMDINKQGRNVTIPSDEVQQAHVEINKKKKTNPKKIKACVSVSGNGSGKEARRVKSKPHIAVTGAIGLAPIQGCAGR